MPTPDEKEIFHVASSLSDPAARSAYLDEACKGDTALRSQIESLLVAFEETGNFLDHNVPIADLVGEAIVKQLESGEMVGRYKILRRIGEGGFGVVYEAEQQQPIKRRVALKVTKLGMDTQQVVARFEAERQALAMMDHANIAKVLDAGATESGRPYFVMELVSGPPITQFCVDNKLNMEDRLRLFIDVCQAVQHAHQKGIIHRDIKPSNVLVARQNDQPVAKVIDFGVAKAIEHRLTERTVFSVHGQLIGTPTYMSPEQASLDCDVDTRSDIYSMGVLLYEMLTGFPPFDEEQLRGAGFDEMRRQICEVDPPTPSSRISGLGHDSLAMLAKQMQSAPEKLSRTLCGELDWIVMKAMEKERNRRYESASNLAEDLQRYLADEPVSAAAPSSIYRMKKYLSRNKGLMAAVTAVGAAMLIGTIASALMAIRAANSEFETKRHLYALDMSIAQRELNVLNTKRAIELIDKYMPVDGEPDFRGFEWRWLWNQTHQELFALQGHTAILRSLRFSHDGKLLASGSRDGTARIWDLATNREIWEFHGGTHCNGADFSRDGQFMVTGFWIENAPEDTPNVILWDVANPNSPEEIVRFQAESTVRFAPEGKSILCAGTVYDLKGKEVRQIFDASSDPGFGHLGSGNQAISRDGETMAALSRSGEGSIWDFLSGELTGSLPKHTGYGDFGFKGVAISPLSNNLIVTSSAQGVRLWDSGGNSLKVLVESGDTLYSQVGFSADGTLLAIRQFQGAIRVFETKSWSEIAVCHTPSPGNTLAFSPNDRDLLVAGGDDGVIRGWRTKPIDSVLEHPGRVCTLKFSPDGKTLAVGMDDGEVWFWDVAAQEVLWKIAASRTIFHSQVSENSFTTDFSVFSEDGRHVAIIGPEDSVTIWNADTHEKIASVRHPEGLRFSSVAVCDNLLFAGELTTNYETGGINVWSWDDSGKPLAFLDKLSHPGWGVKSLTVSPDRTQLAGGQWHSVKIWRTKDLRLARTLEVSPHEDSGAYSLAYSNDGKLLAVGDGHAGSLIWETKSWKRVWHQSNIDGVVDVAFTPDASRVVVSDIRGNSKLWQLSTEQLLAIYDGKCCEFSPNGTILAVGSPGSHWEEDRSDKGRVTLHYVPLLREIESLPAFNPIRTPVVDSD